jgi:hypothetical protein
MNRGASPRTVKPWANERAVIISQMGCSVFKVGLGFTVFVLFFAKSSVAILKKKIQHEIQCH